MPSCTLEDLPRVLARDMRARERRVKSAVRATARKGVGVVQKNAPVAFKELRDSVHTEGTKIVTSAPHASAVEKGSRPHTPPIAPLLAWVRLRGMQALSMSSSGRDARGRFLGRGALGPTGAEHASRVGATLRESIHRGPAPFSEADAAKNLAYAIQQAIAKAGTKPYAYTRMSLPEIESILDANVRAAMPERGAGGEE